MHGRTGGVIVNTAKDARELLVPLFRPREGEKVVALHLDAERRVIATTEEANGSVSEVELPVRAIMADALRFGATGLIVAHNHPSGDPAPSQADLDATRILAATAGHLGIELLDHLIVVGGDCRSLRALGLL